MASFVTSWHRFNTVASSNDANNSSNLIGTTEGTASLDEVSGASITLANPIIVDNSGTELSFSDEIPSNAIITEYQVTSYVSSSNAVFGQELDIIIKGTSITTTTIIDDKNPLSILPYNVGYPIDGPSTTFNAISAGININNIDNLNLEYNYDDPGPSGIWYFHSGDFSNPVPYPAVRFYYELRPKVTITTSGKLSITQGKMHIV